MRNNGGPAFPENRIDDDGNWISIPGMTIRQWYAGQALAGNMAHEATAYATPAQIAQWSHAVADAMIAEGDKSPEEGK